MGDPINRSDRVSYIDTTPSTTATYSFLSEGVTALNLEYNPDVSKKKYVNDVADSAILRGYAPEAAFEFDRYTLNAAQLFIAGIPEAMATGAAAETTYIEFLSSDVDAITGLVDVKQWPVVVSVSTTLSGAAGEEMTCSGSLIVNGDPVDGTFDTADNTFTPDVS